MAFLQLKALSKRYGAVDAVVATDLAVEQGEFVSLLGPSGCGKTTTLQMIAGFVDVSGGQICSTVATLPTPNPPAVAWAWCFRATRCSRI